MNRSLRWLLALVAATALLGAACGDDSDTTAGGSATTTTAADDGGAAAEGPAISIGAQDFGESAILAEIYRQGLESEGFDVSIQELGGFRDLEIAAFDSGDINFAPEYAASLLEFLNGPDKSEATGDISETMGFLEPYLADVGLHALVPSDAVDTNSFVVTKETADRLGLATLSDLATKGADLTLGGPPDCATNPFCIPGLQRVYGVDLSANFQSLEAGAVADALDGGAVDIGIIFSTDGRIADRDWVLLEDDMNLLSADNVVPVIADELFMASNGDALIDRVNEISGALTTENLTELNRRFDVDKEDADAIATSFLEDEGLL
jgi:osmoprotectant transport system substrate-binding protein